MATEVERNWTAHVVIACEHAGLRPYFKALEAEMLHALARVDDPRDVVEYLKWMLAESASFMRKWEFINSVK
jgi:hypothetical protein